MLNVVTFLGLVCSTAGRRGSRWQLRARPMHPGVGGEVLGRAQAGVQRRAETLHHYQVRYLKQSLPYIRPLLAIKLKLSGKKFSLMVISPLFREAATGLY